MVDLETLSVNDSDRFGSLCDQPEILPSESMEDDDDGYDKLEVKKGKKDVEYYNRILNQLIHRGGPDKVKKAYGLLMEMEHENRILPEKHHYTLLMSGCADFGLVKQAFEILKDVLKSWTRPTKAQVTLLFNTCAQSVDKELGLEKAIFLKDYLDSVTYICNTMQYNSMIKAFGRLGQMKIAFSLLKEMRQNRIAITEQTYAMLLMGAISDQEAGFSHGEY